MKTVPCFHPAQLSPALLASGLLVSFTLASQASFTSGLMAWYPFDGNANDASGNGNNPVIVRGTLAADRFGNPNSAWSFNGSSDFIRYANASPTLPRAGSVSVSLWVNFRTMTSGSQASLWFGDEQWARDPYSLGINGAVPDWRTDVGNDSNSHDDPASQGLQAGVWTMLTGTKQLNLDGSVTDKLYINGQLAGQATFASDLQYDTSDMWLSLGAVAHGADPQYTWSAVPLDGLLDDVQVYNRALSQDEITALYNVPEPTALALLGLGLAGLVLKRRTE